MTSLKDTPNPKKHAPKPKLVDKVQRLRDYSTEDQYFALYEELKSVIEDRSEHFQFTYMGLMGVIKMLEHNQLMEMHYE